MARSRLHRVVAVWWWVVVIVGCEQRKDTEQRVWLVVAPASGEHGDVQDADIEPKSAVLLMERAEDRLIVAFAADRIGDRVRVVPKSTCPVIVPKAAFEREATQYVRPEPWLTFGEPRIQLGYGTHFELRARPGCVSAEHGRIEWHVAEGKLDELNTSDHGFRVSARTVDFSEAHPSVPNWGVVPISPRQQGRATLTAIWQDGQRALRFSVVVGAAARERGLPNVAVSQRVFLAGSGWTLTEGPAGAKAELVPTGPLWSFRTQTEGTWTLEDESGAALRLRTGRYDATPLDCGRSECHRAIAEAAPNAMTHTFHDLLQGGLETPDAACTVQCHTTGEPGLEDGGFAHVTREQGQTLHLQPDAQSWPRMSSGQRRLASVGCLACHGPGALPEPSARRTILRTEVCAICHDAPPRYGHVGAWKSTRMSAAAHDARTRREPCARCHTTEGFLNSLARRSGPLPRPDQSPSGDSDVDSASAGVPEHEAPPHDLGTASQGIDCAACHAVHPPGSDGSIPQLLRSVPVPEPFEGLAAAVQPGSALCIACHGGNEPSEVPRATSALIWAGRGGLEPTTGAPLEGTAPHASLEKGCLGCHHGGPAQLRRGSNHGFRASKQACGTCHEPRTLAAAPRERAERMLALLTGRSSDRAASPDKAHLDVQLPASAPLTARRAIHNLLLVLGDGAAQAHNPPYVEALLASAERAISPRAEAP